MSNYVYVLKCALSAYYFSRLSMSKKYHESMILSMRESIIYKSIPEAKSLVDIDGTAVEAEDPTLN